MDLYGALLTGGTLFAIARDELADPRRLFRRLDGAPLTTWVSTPSFARFCLAEPRFAQRHAPGLRRFLFCGETLPVGVARELLARFPRAEVWNMYGPTETTVAVTAVRITDAMVGAGRSAAGRAAGARDRPVDRRPGDPLQRLAGRPARRDRHRRAAGCRRLPAAARRRRSERRSSHSPTAGTPIARETSAPSIRSTARSAAPDVSTARSSCTAIALELEEIEAHLRAVPGVGDGAVLAVERDGRPDHLVAVVVGASDGRPRCPPADGRSPQLVRAARWPNRFPTTPSRASCGACRALPLTSNGKVDRRALRETLG